MVFGIQNFFTKNVYSYHRKKKWKVKEGIQYGSALSGQTGRPFPTCHIPYLGKSVRHCQEHGSLRQAGAAPVYL